jgi:DNA-directed RNA polymerase subunit omega
MKNRRKSKKMLLYPSINKLQEKADSRYSLVILTAKRARDIIDGMPALTEEESERPISQAAKEVAADLITYKRPSAE